MMRERERQPASSSGMASSTLRRRVGKHLNGTPINWQTALAEHGRWLRTVIYARLGEPQAVDEVLQEVSLAAIRQKAPIQDPTKVAPWLYRLAVTQSLLYRRKAGRRRKLIQRYGEKLRPTESDQQRYDPLRWLLDQERKAKLNEALKRLPRRDREILLLKYGEDWTYQRMADHLGIGFAAVQARLHRARQRLRDVLARHEEGEMDDER